jgi:hypothetical protein
MVSGLHCIINAGEGLGQGRRAHLGWRRGHSRGAGLRRCSGIGLMIRAGGPAMASAHLPGLCRAESHGPALCARVCPATGSRKRSRPAFCGLLLQPVGGLEQHPRERAPSIPPLALRPRAPPGAWARRQSANGGTRSACRVKVGRPSDAVGPRPLPPPCSPLVGAAATPSCRARLPSRRRACPSPPSSRPARATASACSGATYMPTQPERV